MKSHLKLSCVGIGLFSAAIAALQAFGATYNVVTDKAGGVYKCGETATFTVRLVSADGLAATEKPYARLDDFGTSVLTNLPFDVTSTDAVFTVSGTLQKPGFLRLSLPKTKKGHNSDPCVFSVGFEPEKIRKGSPSPADFDDFWAKARARLAKEVPLDPQVVRVPERCTADFDFYRISFATFGRRVHGYMSVPTDRSKAPFPVSFGVNAAGFGDWTNDMQGEKDSIRVQFSVYPFPPDWKWKEKGLKSKYDALDAEVKAKYGVDVYSVAGISESRESYFFYPVILGIDRAVDWVAARPDVDPSRFRYEGTSQGGGMGLCLCGLNHAFTRAAFFVPAITDTMGYLKGRASGWPRIVESNSSTPERRAAAERWAPYFDGANFASRIACPVRVAVGFSDTTCPPCAVYAAYNEIGVVDKAIANGIGMTHSCSGRFYDKFGRWLKSDAPAQGLRLERTGDGGWRFGDGALAVTISGRTGWPTAWEVDGARALSGGKTPNTPWCVVFSDADGKSGQKSSGRVKSVSVEAEGPNAIVSRMETDGWRVALRLQLATAERRATGRFEIERTGDEPVRLMRFWNRGGALELGEGGEVLAPAQWPLARVASADFLKGCEVKSRQSGYPIVAADGRGRTVAWLVNQFLPYGDHGLALAVAHEGGADVTQHYYCQGFMRKGERQSVGDMHVLFGRGGVDDALRSLPDWYASVGQTAPTDRPEWMKGALLYSISPRGTRDADRRDGRGLKGVEEYLGAIAALGCDTLWLQPVEDVSPYHPRDYRKLQSGIGSVADYKSLVAAAHKLGLRVWNDIVPHGGDTNTVRFLEHPEWYAVQEDGTVPSYWACDFNWPEWAEYMAGVADYWMRLGPLDGFRIDAAFGARYSNWNPSVPYARASFARLQGGFRMQRALRCAVRRANGRGAVLAESDAGAFNAVSDATWDFAFGERVLPALRERTAEEFVPMLRRWLHERQLALPPGSIMLRYAETHDLLRARDVYGTAAANALGALSAWIGQSLPMVADGMEVGSFEELRRIASIRRAVPELSGGETDYLAPEAPPGVFACMRRGPQLAVPLVNLNGTRVTGEVKLPDGRKLKIDLPPLGYAVLRPDGPLPPTPAPYVSPGVAEADVPTATLVDQRVSADGEVVRVYRLSGCSRWFAHTAEGAFESPCFLPHGDRRRHSSPFYRFERGGNLIWDGRFHPFGFAPEYARFGGIGRKCAVVASVDGANVSLLDSYGKDECLHAEIATSAGSAAQVEWKVVPAESVRAPETGTGDRRLQTVVGGWMFDDGNLRVHLQRNGALRGVWRRERGMWRKLSGAIYVKAEGEKTYDQASDVEPVAKLSRGKDGTLRLAFGGALRNLERTGKMPNASSYRTVYTLGGKAGAVLETSFKADASGKGAKTVLKTEWLADEIKPAVSDASGATVFSFTPASR